tara:strand:+ start:5629 stop:5784 length:156 start_codon:yes stop_codon:yes gene_type:complete
MPALTGLFGIVPQSGRGLLVGGWWLVVVGCWVVVGGWWLLGVSCWVLVVGC